MFRRGKREDEQVPEEPLHVDLTTGTITQADGARFVAMESHGWATIEKELQSTFITGAAVILQRVGYSYGRAVGRAAKRQEVPPEQAFVTMQKVARGQGWGGLNLNSGDLLGGVAKITVRDCFFCLHSRESPEPVCYVLTGLVNGMADEIIGVSHRTTEQRCIAKGDAVCEIQIERLG